MAGSTSPMSKLSLDVLSSIFLFCLPAHTWDDPGPGLSCDHPSVVLSHVCHFWRQVVIGNPQLWSEVYVTVPSIEDQDDGLHSWIVAMQSTTDKITSWLDRAGHCPLFLLLHIPCLYFKPTEEETGSAMYKDLLEAVFLHHSQIRCMGIRAPCHSKILGPFTDVFMGKMVDGFPLLSSFTAETLGSVSSSFAEWMAGSMLLRLLSSAPLLRRLFVSGQWGLLPEWMAGRIEKCTYAAHLTHLVAYQYSMDKRRPPFDASNMFMLLEVCRNLVDAAFILQSDRNRETQKVKTPITLPHLERLSLQGVPPKPGSLALLQLPSLKAAYLVFDEFTPTPTEYLWTPSDPESTIEFIQKFGPQLSQVAINPDILSPSEMTMCLECVDNVEVLSLINPQFPCLGPGGGGNGGWASAGGDTDSEQTDEREEQACRMLTYLAKTDVFPNLQRLEMIVRNMSNSELCERALVDFIASRRRKIADIEGKDEGQRTGEDGEDGEVAPTTRACVADVHIVFSNPHHVEIVQELDGQGVDLDIDPFNLRLVYPGSSGGLGTLSESPWTHQRCMSNIPCIR